MKKLLFSLTCIGIGISTFADQSQLVATTTAKPTASNNAFSPKTATTTTNNVVVTIPCPINSPCAVVSDTSKQVLLAINKDASAEQIQAIVAPQFDFTLMTKYALGNNWKLASTAQQAQLVDLFKQLLIYTYSSAISKFKNAQITITSADNDERKAMVVSQVLLPNSSNNQPVKVEYDLAKLPTSTSWKAYDIKIENASLVTTYRNQFNDVIQSSKIDGLIKQLQTKIAGLQQAKGE